MNAYAFVLVKGKLLQFVALKQFEKKGDIEAARQMAKQWALAQVAQK